jgi:hypothetical protein
MPDPVSPDDPRLVGGEAMIERMKEPVTVTPDEAFEIYRKLETPTVTETAKILMDAGHKVSLATVTQWASKWDWKARVQNPDQRLQVTPRALLAQLTDEGKYLEPEVLRGVQNRVVVRLAHLLKHIKVDGMKDVSAMVEVVERLQALTERKESEKSAKPKRSAEREPASNTIDLGAFKVRTK